MKTQHPKVVVFVSGQPVVIDCDCGWCERREPLMGAAIVLLSAAVVASFLLWVIG